LLLRLAMATQKKRVSYYYDPDIGNFYYGQVGERTPARSRAVLPLPLRPPSTRVWVGPTRGPARVLALHTLSGAALCPAVCAGASDEAAPHPGRPPPHRGTCAPRVPAQACDSSSPALRAPAFSFLVSFCCSCAQAYDLYRKMEVLRPTPSTAQEMTKFHSNDYVAFMQNVRPRWRLLPPEFSRLRPTARRCLLLRRSPRTTTRTPSSGRS
jgi:hypothetical protein